MPPPKETFAPLIYVSEPYKPPIVVVTHGNSSKGVRQMSGGKGIKSKLNRLYEGEKPALAKGEPKTKADVKCTFLTSEGFKYSSGMKVSNNRGDYTSTFTKPIEHIPISTPETDEEKTGGGRRVKKKRLPAIPKNITTSPYREAVFNKFPYMTPSVDSIPKPKKSGHGSFTFTKKNDLFAKVDYVPQNAIVKSKSEGEMDKTKGLTNLNCGSFRPSSPVINSKAAVAGTFSPYRYEGTVYDEKLRRHATTPDKLRSLPSPAKAWL